MTLVLRLAGALALTVLVEGVLMLALARSWRPVYYTLLCNLLTNPLLNLGLLAAGGLWGRPGYYTALALGEAAVVVAEGLLLALLCHWPRKRAFAAALLLNTASLTLGWLVFWVL